MVLITEQMRQVLALVIGKVSPEKTEEEVKMAVKKVDWEMVSTSSSAMDICDVQEDWMTGCVSKPPYVDDAVMHMCLCLCVCVSVCV